MNLMSSLDNTVAVLLGIKNRLVNEGFSEKMAEAMTLELLKKGA